MTSTKISLVLYTLPGCGPCDVVKEALDGEAASERFDLSSRAMTLDEMRSFRKTHGQLGFPILEAMREGVAIAHRVGAISPDVEEERQDLRGWLAELSGE